MGEVCDTTEIGTLNDGSINTVVGNAIICQQMGGKIAIKQNNSIVVYTQKKDKQKKKKEQKADIEITMEPDKEEIIEQTSLLDMEEK